MTLLRWRFGRSAADVLSRSSGPPAGRHVMNSASFEPASTAGRSCRTRGSSTGLRAGAAVPDLRRHRAGVPGAGHTLAQPPADLAVRQRRTLSWTGWPCCDPAGGIHCRGDQLAAPLYGQHAGPEPCPRGRRDGYPAGRGHGNLAGTGQHADRAESATPPGTCRHGRGGHVDDLDTRLSHRYVRRYLVRRLSPGRARQPECRRRPADRRGDLVGSPRAVLPARHLPHGHRLAGRHRQPRREREPGRIVQHACRLASPAPRLAFTAHPAVKNFQAHAPSG